jgi:hypothetical protein
MGESKRQFVVNLLATSASIPLFDCRHGGIVEKLRWRSRRGLGNLLKRQAVCLGAVMISNINWL